MRAIIKISLITAIVLVGTMFLWPIMSLVLSSNKGLDLTDESLLLINANPGTAYSAWGFPWGWHTWVLFKIVNYNISDFRTGGSILLLVAGGILGLQLGRYINSFSLIEKKRISMLLFMTSYGALGTLFFYAGFIRSPGYNWLNLFGIYIAASGYIELYLVLRNNRSLNFIENIRIGAWISLGLFITIPAKPTTIFLTFLVGLLPLIKFPHKNWLKAIGIIPIWVLIYISVAIFLKIWPLDFYNYFKIALNSPSLAENHSLLSAIIDVILVPKELINTLKIYNLFGVALIIYYLFKNNNSYILYIGFSSLFISLLFSTKTIGMWDSAQISRYFFHPFVTALLLINITIFVICIFDFKNKKYQFSYLEDILLIGIFLCALPFIFGFGSGMGCYRNGSLALGFFLLNSAIPIGIINDKKFRLFYTISLTLFSLNLLCVMLADSYKKPYRMAPISQMTQNVKFELNKTHLKLDPITASILESLKRQAVANKWRPGIPLIGFLSKCSSGVVYFLGGGAPITTELAWCGYQNTLRVAEYKLCKSVVAGFPVSQAWVLTGALPGWECSIDENDVAKLLSPHLEMNNTKFPEDYFIAAQSGTIKLWSPGKP